MRSFVAIALGLLIGVAAAIGLAVAVYSLVPVAATPTPAPPATPVPTATPAAMLSWPLLVAAPGPDGSTIDLAAYGGKGFATILPA
jgi:hypothetical protein